MELDRSFADKVSFIELISLPTTGRTEEAVFWKLFELQHAEKSILWSQTATENSSFCLAQS